MNFRNFSNNNSFAWHGILRVNYFLLLSCLLMFGSAEYCAAEDEPQKSVLEEVVVTATKTGETVLQETPLSITVLSATQLNNSNASYMEDLTAMVPNAVFEIFGPGRTVGYIRGIGSSNTNFGSEQNVGFYLDGVYLNRGIGANAAFFDVERIEVLRGPQGTLYGRNTTGGAVNIITSRPSDEFDLKLGVDVGNFSKRRVDATISGPIIEYKVKARITFSDSSHDGYLENTTGNDLYEEDFTAVRGVLELAPTDKLNILLSWDYYESESFGMNNRLMSDTGLPAIMAALSGIPKSTYLPDDYWQTAQDFDSNLVYELWGITGKVDFELSNNLSMHSITAYRDTSKDLAEDLDSTPVTLFDVVNFLDYTNFSQEIQFNWTLDRWNWVLGLYYFDEEENIEQPNTFHFIIPGLLQNRIGKIDTTAWAFFGNASFDINDRLSVEVGLRYSYEEKDMLLHEATTSPFPFPPFIVSDPPESKDWDALTPKFGINYQISDEAMLYGIISRGFKSGAFSVANPPGSKWVDPEFLWNYEMGFKTDWFDNRLRANGSIFYYDYTDLQARTLSVQGHIVTNAAEASVRGAELEFMARPSPALTLNGSISYLDAEYEKFATLGSDGQPLDASGNPLPNAPEWKLVFGVQYEIPVRDYGHLTLRGDITWMDDMFFTQFADPRVAQEAYTLVNAIIRFETTSGHWSFELYGKNLGEEERLVSAIDFLGAVIGNVGAPRTFGMQATYQY